MTQRTCNVLFLCSGNSARSQMAEALSNVLGGGRIRAYSAGCNPAIHVQPLALSSIDDLGYSIEQLRPKSWEEFAIPSGVAPR